ncbi:S41 family peptidase [uncultured Winogradskyella sp.]|uniref:S41 family peptidase n=1 Tax=Winogradskyella sp. 4-2091 TaxID=3381659 RepID=UPI00262A816A|nr:S41 family peptidase [uncultured Winogradskyella sp.]
MLKFIKFSFIFLLSILSLNAQISDCSCVNDLNFLNEKIQKTPSYKVSKVDYEKAYSKIKEAVKNLGSGYDCFLQLNILMLSLNDRHCNLYGINKGATEQIKKNDKKFNEFKNSKLFAAYPKPTIDIDSLTTALKKQSNNSIEGIYYRKNNMSIGVYKSLETDFYNVIVLNSENELWKTGELIYTLVPYGNNYLLAVGGSLSSKRMIAFGERIENGVFLTLGFQKDESVVNYSVSIHPESTYLKREISPETIYLKAGSFSSWNPKLSEADQFYKSLEGKLIHKNLILDLRDNGGGGNRNSDGLYKVLKKFLKNNNVYVLVNNRTASNAEQFAYKLSEFQNCTILGNRTNGTLAYEIVDSNYNLPCNNLLAVLTSKKHGKYLKFESKGIEPDVKLSSTLDWIIQVKNYIQENN